MSVDAIERAAAEAAQARDGEVDAGERKRHGIVHTPPALARFVARSVDEALRAVGRAGLADPEVVVLDPACGPGAFLAASLACAAPGAPRLALGLDRDPQAIDRARAILAAPAAEAGWPLRLVATDTLASLDVLTPDERAGATLAVLGNPPWAGRSASRGESLSEGLLDDFRRDGEGRSLGERKIGVLSDAYVRFWRWACELARHAEGGAVVALVTNASFLDGPVHRGMRGAIARWFARVDVLHLGGSALVARRGDRDENVFRVRPAVAVTLAVRPPAPTARVGACVRFAALRGTREAKLARLAEAGGMAGLPLAGLPLAELTTPGPWVPSAAIDERYARWPSLPALMPFHREGLQSNRDAFCVDVDRESLVARLRAFADGAPGPWPGRADVTSGHYDPERARAAIRACDLDEAVARVAYRPLDDRWMAVVPGLCHRPRPALRAAMARSEVALLTVRKDRGEREWAHFGVSAYVPDNCYLSARSSCRTRAFPTHGPDGAPNLDASALASWASRLSGLPTARELVRYVLCVLASAAYRARFDDALRADYPRIPPPPSLGAWDAAVAAGRALERAFRDAADASLPARARSTEGRSGLAVPNGECSRRAVVGHHTVAQSVALARAADLAEHAVEPLLGG